MHNTLEVISYHHLRGNKEKLLLFNHIYTGEIESIAYASFNDSKSSVNDLNFVEKKIRNPKQIKHINIFRIIGFFLQKQKHVDDISSNSALLEYFNSCSIKYKYLIVSFFPFLESRLNNFLNTQAAPQYLEEKVIFSLYENNGNYSDILTEIEELKVEEIEDIIQLILIEDFNRKKSSMYKELRKKLLDKIIEICVEIQSKHTVFGNNEDQYNAILHTTLNTQENFRAENQSQRGDSSNKRTFGELDVSVYSKDNFPLSILEAFVINSVEKKYIKKHLVKLSKNYDPNGLKQNFAIIYAKSENFVDFWSRYKNFVSKEMIHPLKLIPDGFCDITESHLEIANVKIGLSIHKNNDIEVEIYHIFINCYYD